jgi:hypothetical protein
MISNNRTIEYNIFCETDLKNKSIPNMLFIGYYKEKKDAKIALDNLKTDFL